MALPLLGIVGRLVYLGESRAFWGQVVLVRFPFEAEAREGQALFEGPEMAGPDC